MKLLFVYYSRTGFTERAVQSLKDALTKETMTVPREQAARQARERLGVETRLIRLETQKKIGFIPAILQSLRKRPAAISEIKPPPDMGKYDAVIVAGPIWASGICSPLRAFLSKYKGAKKLYAIHTHSSDNPSPAATAEMETLLGMKASAVLELCTVKGDTIEEKVLAFAETLGC